MGFDLTGLGSLSTLIDDVLKYIPNPVDKAVAQEKITELMAKIAEEQSQTNTAEASTGKFFLAGWRAFIGWIGGLGLLYSIIQGPLHLPKIDTTPLIKLLGGMLGLLS